MIIQAIEKALATSSHHHQLKQIMHYAVLPAGKLFRPRLVEALAADLGQAHKSDYLHLGAAIELHHAYTLVHDDLPAMDNDSVRRGKPSTHVQFGEWKAILCGDALLIASFEELMKIDHPNLRGLHRLFTWCTGGKGLISGQFLDLLADGKLSFPEVLRIHELKTARLIQVATLGSYLLSCQRTDSSSTLSFFRLGRVIGVSFQLLDDLTELTDAELSPHETLINPFLLSPAEAIRELRSSHQRLQKTLNKKQLKNLSSMLNDYFSNSQKQLLAGKDHLQKNIDAKIWVELESWITSFA